MTPIIRANANVSNSGPPQTNKEVTASNVVNDVITVRPRVEFKDLLIISSIESAEKFSLVSRKRSKTTIVSFKEYPSIVKNAATICKLIGIFRIEKILARFC